MPSRNVQKQDVSESYYHIYARGINKQSIFQDHRDYKYFIALFERYLSNEKKLDKVGIPYPNFSQDIELMAYCLMGNHFHMLIYQVNQGAMSRLMKSIMTSYSRYFNLKYKRTGALWEETYKASRIDADNYLAHISRYIHLNPRSWLYYKYSSIGFYLGNDSSEWIKKDRIMDIFSSAKAYRVFLEDYLEQREIINELKHELANL